MNDDPTREERAHSLWPAAVAEPHAYLGVFNPVGYYVLVRGVAGAWEADWSGELHFTIEDAMKDYEAARANGYEAALCALACIARGPGDNVDGSDEP